MKIVGYYHANSNHHHHLPSPVAKRIADKVYDVVKEDDKYAASDNPSPAACAHGHASSFAVHSLRFQGALVSTSLWWTFAFFSCAGGSRPLLRCEMTGKDVSGRSADACLIMLDNRQLEKLGAILSTGVATVAACAAPSLFMHTRQGRWDDESHVPRTCCSLPSAALLTCTCL